MAGRLPKTNYKLDIIITARIDFARISYSHEGGGTLIKTLICRINCDAEHMSPKYVRYVRWDIIALCAPIETGMFDHIGIEYQGNCHHICRQGVSFTRTGPNWFAMARKSFAFDDEFRAHSLHFNSSAPRPYRSLLLTAGWAHKRRMRM